MTLREWLDSGKEKIAASAFGLQLSAFGDMHSSYKDSGEQSLNWGDFEIDASLDISNDLQGAMAVVRGDGKTEFPVGFLDYHTSGGSIAPRGRLWVEKGFHIQIGRFDVPFGSDWQFFASKDSVSISRPLTTELVMDGGYNDRGMRLLGNDGSINFNAYLLRGFSSGRLVGGRIGITPFTDPFSLRNTKEPKTVEFGISYLYNTNTNWKKTETAIAVDSEFHQDAWTGRFEYVVRRKDPVLSDGITSLRGWHYTQEYALPKAVAWPTTVFARYDRGSVQPAEIDMPGSGSGDARDTRIALGFRSNLGNSDLLQWKVEVQHYLAATPGTREMPGYGHGVLWFTQLVVLL